jgi:hypothetical protein
VFQGTRLRGRALIWTAGAAALRNHAAAGCAKQDKNNYQQVLPNHLMTSKDKRRFIEEATQMLQSSDAAVYLRESTVELSVFSDWEKFNDYFGNNDGSRGK